VFALQHFKEIIEMSADTRELTYAAPASHYDPVTIALHWTTAILVLAQFGSAHIWELLQKGTPWRIGLISTHAALGIILAAVIALRICWRLMNRGKLPPAVSGLQHLAASAVHGLLYVLLVTQVTLGFLLGWSAGNALRFFTLFSIPPLAVVPPDMRHLVGELHNYTAWTIIGFAFVHAAAALMHHYVLKDRVLHRMIPGVSPRS
jgi:cytochrome b561